MGGGKTLFLFDIDGTVLRRAGPAHREALEFAASHHAGCAVSVEGVPVAGMLDRDILRLAMGAAGLKPRVISRLMPAIVEHAQELYQETCPELRDKVCPGIPEFLSQLQARKIPCGLVTGNLSRIGWRKMEQAGLRDYFSFGAFAEMGRTRADLARMAMREARRLALAARGARVLLVGDHPNDILAAQANGIEVVSVATGVIGREELAKHRPDFLLDDIRGFPWEILEVS